MPRPERPRPPVNEHELAQQRGNVSEEALEAHLEGTSLLQQATNSILKRVRDIAPVLDAKELEPILKTLLAHAQPAPQKRIGVEVTTGGRSQAVRAQSIADDARTILAALPSSERTALMESLERDGVLDAEEVLTVSSP